MPDQAQPIVKVEYCPHCGGDLTPGARRRSRPLSPERLPLHPFRGLRAWHLLVAVLLAALVVVMLIRVLGSPPAMFDPSYNGGRIAPPGPVGAAARAA